MTTSVQQIETLPSDEAMRLGVSWVSNMMEHVDHGKDGVCSVENPHQPDQIVANVDPPPIYKVVLINDDFTPMEFVVDILKNFFYLSLDDSIRIMLKIHHEGRGVCGSYSRDVALTKVDQVFSASQKAGHPLQCILEAE